MKVLYYMEPSVVLYTGEPEESYLKMQAFSSGADRYGRPMSNVFQKPSILIANLGLRSKNPAFQIKNFEMQGFSPIEFKIMCILSEVARIFKTWYFNWKAGTEKIITHFFYKQSFF